MTAITGTNINIKHISDKPTATNEKGHIRIVCLKSNTRDMDNVPPKSLIARC